MARRPRHLPFFDSLETRFALSMGGAIDPNPGPPYGEIMPFDAAPSVVRIDSVDPAPDSVLRHAPTSLSVRFDRPIDPSSVFYDMRLATEASPGEWVPFGDYEGYPTDISLDDAGTTLTASFGTLPDGHYRLILAGDSGLMGLDGSSIQTVGTDQILSSFGIRSVGVTLADATDLGTIGGDVQSIGGTLDFATNPTDVHLYKIELSQGHFWRLGTEISAGREGSQAQIGITIFDADGHPLVSQTVGRRDFPSDPYLFRGLPAGSYYIGVSDKANLPNVAGGYNPVSGSGGVSTPDHPSGSYHLQVVAEPADQPVGVLALVINHADPSSADPTGFTVQFSGPLDSTSLTQSTTPRLTLVDVAGKAWPITAVGYDESQATLTYVFDQALPAGRYKVIVPDGGITDLAGYTPSSTGETGGYLGTLTVPATFGSGSRTDFGILLPSVATKGLNHVVSVGQVTPTDSRFVVTVEGHYTFNLTAMGGHPTVTLVDSDGNSQVLKLGLTDADSRTLVMLKPGAYHLHFQPEAGRGSLVTLGFRLTQSMADSLVDNGVGQGPGVLIRLVSPTPIPNTDLFVPAPTGAVDFSPPSSSNTGPFGPSLAQQAGGSTTPGIGESAGEVSTPGTSNAGTGSSITYAVAGLAPVGSPSSTSAGVGAVGPGAGNSGESIAANLPTGQGGSVTASLGRMVRRSVEKTDRNQNHQEDDPDADATLTDGRLAVADLDESVTFASLYGNTDGQERDGASVDQAFRLSPILVSLPFGGKASDPVQGAESDVEIAADPAVLLASDLPENAKGRSGAREDREYADMSSSLGVGLIAVAAAHYQRQIGLWFGRVKQRINPGSRVHPGAPAGRRPHLPRPRPGV